MYVENVVEKQREICSVIIALFNSGNLCLNRKEREIVLVMKRTNECLKDWHLAILKTFLLRETNEIKKEV